MMQLCFVCCSDILLKNYSSVVLHSLLYILYAICVTEDLNPLLCYDNFFQIILKASFCVYKPKINKINPSLKWCNLFVVLSPSLSYHCFIQFHTIVLYNGMTVS